MSMSMQGYFLMVPEWCWPAVLETHVRRLLDIVTSDRCNHDKIVALDALNVQSEYIAECAGLGSDEENELLSIIGDHLDTIRQFDVTTDWRDLADMIHHVNGNSVRMMFAGGASWGDEPDSDGYKMLRAANMVGLYEAFDNAIPWGAHPMPGRRPPSPSAPCDPSRGVQEDPHG
jgi:hypothetical protein